jgi:hypothetical protein
MTAICSKCNENKPTTEFYKCSRTKTGFQKWCKSCYKANRPSHSSKFKPSDINKSSETISVSIVEMALIHAPSFSAFSAVSKLFTKQSSSRETYEILMKVCSMNYPNEYVEFVRCLLPEDTDDNSIISDNTENNEINENNENNENNKNTDTRKKYITQYANDDTLTQVGDDIESDDDYSVQAVRYGDTWRKIKISKA